MSEELDKTPAILNIDSEIESRHHPIQHANVFPPIIQPPHRACTSLPLYLQAKSDLCTLVPRPGMEYVPLRTPAAEPYHYHHVTDQTKSLQELQNEVGALLEFRDLVIETFPDLKTKMASSAANSTLTGIPSTSSSLAIRREWEPGIRIRRKLIPKDTGSGSIGGGGSSSSTTIIPGVGGSNSGSISGSSNHSNHAVGHGASGGAPVGASVAGSSGSSSSSTTTTTTALNQQQQPQQQHTHQHHHHHHHHTHTQHGSNSSGNHHPHQQQQQQQQQQHSSSSLIRSRSNSHSGKKEPKSGEGNNGSVIQDSGFSTETSSSKETHSAASSTSGAVQGALILSTTINRLAVETEDELWNLLDVIHRKGSRLREEVDQHLEREKNRATNLAINHPLHQHPAHHPHPHPQSQSHQHHHHHHHPHLQQQQHAAAVPTSSAAPVHLQQQPPVVATVATARGGTGGDGGTGGHSHSGSSSSSTSSGNNITIHHSNPATPTNVASSSSNNNSSSSSSSSSAVSASTSSSNSTAKATTTTVIVSSAGGPIAAAGGGGGTLAKSFQNQLLLAAGGAGREQPAAPGVAVSGGGGTATTGPVDHNVQILRNERDRLLDKLSAYEAETFAGRLREAKMHDELETLTLTMRDLQEQLKVAHSQKLELNSKLHDLHLQTVNRSAPSSPESIKVRQQHQGSATLQSSSQHAPKPATRYHQPHYQHGAVTGASGKPSAATASPHEDPLGAEGATGAASSAGGAAAGGLGRLDALLGSPRLPKVRSLDSKKIAAILLETNIVELQRHLLTVTVQNQVLQQRLEQATRSRLFLSEKFEKSKEDLDDLRFQLMEKSIELEGTKAQLRVIESKSASGRSAPPSAETSPEHAARGPTVAAQQQPQHHAGHLLQHHQLHHHHHPHHHQQQQQQQQQHPGVPSVAVNSQLAMRLASSQVSTPSMKAMTPVAMDDMIAQHQQHSSSTESAQDQAERDSIGGRLQQQSQHHQAPETPRRRPSKIPLPGTKGSAAPKPPSGRNFSATPTPTTPTGPTAMQRTLGGGGGSSGPSSNRSLTKSTGSLYVKSSDASSFGGGAQHQHLVTTMTTTTTTTTGSSWRNSSSSSSNSTSKDTPSLEKSRSSSIPIASTPKGSQQQPLGPSPGERGMTGTRGTPTMMALPPPPIPPSAAFHGGGVVSSSPLPRPKRDTLTTKVKNCDSLSRKQSLRKDVPNASIGSGQSATFAGSPAVPAPAVRERKPSAGGSVLRHASSTSLGSGGHGADTATSQPQQQQQQPASGNANSSTNSTTTSDNGKARRSNTFRLAKPTLMPLLLATGPSCPGLVPALPLPGIGPAHEPVSPKLPAATTAADASPQRTGVALRSLAINTTGSHGGGSASARTRSQTSTGGTVTGADRTVPSVSVVRAAFSTPSVAGERIARNLIGEYLAAKRTRCDAQQQQQQQQQAQQQMPIPPPIFHVHQSSSAGHLVDRQRCERQNEELAYKHPRLLMTDDAADDEADAASCGASNSFSAGGYGVGESEDDCSIELVLQDDSPGRSGHCGTNGHEDDDGEEETSAANESLIVPRPKMIAFHSLKGGKERQQQQQQQQRPICSPPASSTCRLVGKVNPNILKTWEQLSGGGQQYNSCMHQQPKRRSASAGRILLLAEECSVGDTTGEQAATPPHPLRAATSTSGFLHFDTGGGGEETEASDDGESADERQSCLLYCPQQRPYHHHLGDADGDEGEKEAEEEVIEFKVNKLQHHPAVSSAVRSSGTSAGATTTTVGSTSSEGADFYDSIDAVSTCVREPSAATRPGHGAFLPVGDDDEDDGRRNADDNYTDLPSVAGGEGLAEFTSIDRKQLLWSIEIGEQQ